VDLENNAGTIAFALDFVRLSVEFQLFYMAFSLVFRIFWVNALSQASQGLIPLAIIYTAASQETSIVLDLPNGIKWEIRTSVIPFLLFIISSILQLSFSFDSFAAVFFGIGFMPLWRLSGFSTQIKPRIQKLEERAELQRLVTLRTFRSIVNFKLEEPPKAEEKVYEESIDFIHVQQHEEEVSNGNEGAVFEHTETSPERPASQEVIHVTTFDPDDDIHNSSRQSRSNSGNRKSTDSTGVKHEDDIVIVSASPERPES
jgi:hypothetical protein